MDVLLNVKNLQKYYGTRAIFPPNFSFSLFRGQILIVLGGSGVGKSTLFKSILGVVDYTGQVSIFSPYSFLMTENNMDLNLSLLDNFLEYYHAYGLNYNLKDINDYISKNQSVKLEDYAKTCSWGTLRRFALYRVLFELGSQLILLDEPTTGADVNNVKKLKKILRAYDNKGFFIITHDRQLSLIGTKLLFLSELAYVVESSKKGGYIRLSLETYNNLNLVDQSELIYKSTKEDGVIIYVKEPLSYNNLVLQLSGLKVPHKCTWVDLNQLAKLVEIYF